MSLSSIESVDQNSVVVKKIYSFFRVKLLFQSYIILYKKIKHNKVLGLKVIRIPTSDYLYHKQKIIDIVHGNFITKSESLF